MKSFEVYLEKILSYFEKQLTLFVSLIGLIIVVFIG